MSNNSAGYESYIRGMRIEKSVPFGWMQLLKIKVNKFWRFLD